MEEFDGRVDGLDGLIDRWNECTIDLYVNSFHRTYVINDITYLSRIRITNYHVGIALSTFARSFLQHKIGHSQTRIILSFFC